MAWEWVAPTATGVVGVAGVFFTWLTAKGGRGHAETLAQQRIDHEEKMAIMQRRQQRMAEAYIELLTMAERAGQWASFVRPMWDTDPPRPKPPLPELAEQARVEALVRAYGSHQVLQRWESWRVVIREIIDADDVIALDDAAAEKGRDSGLDAPKAWKILDPLRRREQELRKRLTDQVAGELQSRQQ